MGCNKIPHRFYKGSQGILICGLEIFGEVMAESQSTLIEGKNPETLLDSSIPTVDDLKGTFDEDYLRIKPFW